MVLNVYCMGFLGADFIQKALTYLLDGSNSASIVDSAASRTTAACIEIALICLVLLCRCCEWAACQLLFAWLAVLVAGLTAVEKPHVVRYFCGLSRVKGGAERREGHSKLPSWEGSHSQSTLSHCHRNPAGLRTV